MPRETVRVQVTLPGELLDAIDSLVGRRARSRFMIEAAEEKLRRERLGRSLERVAGSLVGKDTPPEWDSSEGRCPVGA
jgi:metal-responsive CopG/Arc/MetJ family transcriptional regulator